MKINSYESLVNRCVYERKVNTFSYFFPFPSYISYFPLSFLLLVYPGKCPKTNNKLLQKPNQTVCLGKEGGQKVSKGKSTHLPISFLPFPYYFS